MYKSKFLTFLPKSMLLPSSPTRERSPTLSVPQAGSLAVTSGPPLSQPTSSSSAIPVCSTSRYTQNLITVSTSGVWRPKLPPPPAGLFQPHLSQRPASVRELPSFPIQTARAMLLKLTSSLHPFIQNLLMAFHLSPGTCLQRPRGSHDLPSPCCGRDSISRVLT